MPYATPSAAIAATTETDMATLSPAMVQELVRVSQAAASAPHGKKQIIYDAACKSLGITNATLHRYMAQVSVRKDRKERSDAGCHNLSIDDARTISTYMMDHYRGNGKRGITLIDALNDMRKNRLIKAEYLDEESGEIKPISPSAIAKALKTYGLHWDQMLAAATTFAVKQSSPHPNHTWQIDASVCTLFYLDDDGSQPMPEAVFYKNRPENFERVAKQRVTRFVLTDHTSATIAARYYFGGESAANYTEFFLWAISKRPGNPFHGVPFNLMADPGSGLQGAFANLVRRLSINLIINKAGNPRAKGQVENAQNLVEMGFEHQFRSHRPKNLAELNARLEQWCIHYNATAIHNRFASPRINKWLCITADQLRIAPSIERCREFALGKTEFRSVDQFGQIQFDGRNWDVKTVPSVAKGQKLEISYSAYNDREVFCIYRAPDGSEVLHACPLVDQGEHGFDTTANEIGAGYKALPETQSDQETKAALLLTTGASTLQEAENIKSKKGFESMQGRVRFDYIEAENKALPTVLPKRGTALDVKTTTTATAASVRTLSPFEAAQALSASGIKMTADIANTLRTQYAQGVPEDELDALKHRFSVRSSLKVVNGGAL